ncbi:chorismate mutase [Orobanche gracilis]
MAAIQDASTPSLTFLLYSAYIFLVLFSCFPEKIQALESHSDTSNSTSVCTTPSIADSLRNLDSLRESLARQEDSVIFCLIERSKYPMNSQLYEKKKAKPSDSLFESFVKESESVQAKAGRYRFEEENSFYPNSPPPTQPPLNCTPVLHGPRALFNINANISTMYVKTLLPLIAAKGDDGNYAPTAVSDLLCLQVLSRRIHYGKFVAEAKFISAPQNYTRAIKAEDKDALTRFLTVRSLEDVIKKRVERKATIFGQDVDNQEGIKTKYKVKPSVVSSLYNDWVIPLTKSVEVEYLLQRLDS